MTPQGVVSYEEETFEARYPDKYGPGGARDLIRCPSDVEPFVLRKNNTQTELSISNSFKAAGAWSLAPPVLTPAPLAPPKHKDQTKAE